MTDAAFGSECDGPGCGSTMGGMCDKHAREAHNPPAPESRAAYLLFRGEFYYPGGGWDDYVGTFSTLDEAKAAVTPTEFQWAHVVDLSTGEIVARQEAKRPWEML